MSQIPFVNFKSHFLIAMPTMADPSFIQTLTIICEHSPQGALGVVLNRPTTLSMSKIYQRLGYRQTCIDVNSYPVYSGGPVSQRRGFVLNSGERNWNNCIELTQGLQLVTSKDVVLAMSEGKGPAKAMFVLGCAGWDAGQLEKEISENAWLTCEADPHIIFDTPYHLRYKEAANTLGIDMNLISGQVGHS